MSFDFDAVNAAITAHGHVARVVIVDVKGSSPREVGASMLVWADGQSGSIGGGALEFAAAQAARDGKVGISTHPLGPELGQCCGGAVTLVCEQFDAPLDPAFSYMRRVAGDDETPGIMQKFAKDIAKGTSQGRLMYRRGWLCEPRTHQTGRPIWIWGAGHVGREVVDILGQLTQFQITWLDYAWDRFPDRTKGAFHPRLYDPVPDTAKTAPQTAQHFIMTHSHDTDLEICHALLTHDFLACGLIGSATKAARFRKRLLALGHTEQQVATIACPIGDRSLGKHPAAIAVSIAHAILSS